MAEPLRIVIVGTSGSGKTTLARRAAAALSAPHIELDSLHWEPNWTEAATEVFRSRVTEAVAADSWVVDGNYSKTRDIVWARATTVVWLDYSFTRVFSQLVHRTLRRLVSQEELWNGNKEDWATQFTTNDSIFLWAVKAYPRYKREYRHLFALPEHAHLRVVHLRRPADAEAWLRTLPSFALAKD